MAGIYGGSDEDRYFEGKLNKYIAEEDYDEAEETEYEAREWQDVDNQIRDMDDREADYECPAWREP